MVIRNRYLKFLLLKRVKHCIIDSESNSIKSSGHQEMARNFDPKQMIDILSFNDINGYLLYPNNRGIEVKKFVWNIETKRMDLLNLPLKILVRIYMETIGLFREDN